MDMFLRQPGDHGRILRDGRSMALRLTLLRDLLLSDIVNRSIAEGYRFSLCISVISVYRSAMEKHKQVDTCVLVYVCTYELPPVLHLQTKSQ